MIRGIFLPLEETGPKHGKKSKVGLFLARLLAPLPLASQPQFCLVTEVSCLTVGLAIRGAVLIKGEFAIRFLG